MKGKMDRAFLILKRVLQIDILKGKRVQLRKGIFMERVAIIDMGSNSIRFIIMQIAENHSYRLEYQQKEAIRLGRGMSETGKLNPAGVKRAMECLKVYHHMMEVMKITKCIAVATAAARNAKDGPAFIERIKRETGIEVTVISGEREAYLGYLGVVNTIAEDHYLQFDLGGASIEVSLVEHRKIVESVSVPIGAVTVTDAFNLSDKVTSAALDRCKSFIQEKYETMIPWAKGVNLPIIGVGGTVRNLAKMDQAHTNYQLARIHNYIIPRKRFDDNYNAIIKSSLANRRRMRGLSTERADIIVAGALIIRCLVEFAGGRDLIVSGCGLREGVFYEYYGEKYGQGPVVQDILRASVKNYLGTTECQPEHLARVRDLALSLFDQLRPLHKAGRRERELLEVAASMHDSGKTINYYEHARHSAFIIAHAPIYGMRQKEQLIASFIAGFHHGISNKIMRSYRYAMMLTQEDWQLVRRLSLLLALSEAADVTYEGVVTGFDVTNDEEGVVLAVRSGKGTSHSAADFEMKTYAKQFKKEYGKPLIILWHKD